MLVTIPISSFSKAIILTEFECEPVTLKSNHIYYQMLHYRSELKWPERMRKLLNDNIMISASINKRDVDMISMVGYHIHKYHVQKMYDFVYARYLLDVQVAHSIRLFNDIYGITEDDMPYETQYRNWSRWLKYFKNSHQIAAQNRKIVRDNDEVLKVDLPLQVEEVNVLTLRIVEEYPYFFKSVRKQPLKVMVRRLEFYLLVNFTQLSEAGVAELYACNIDTVYTGLRYMKKYLQRKPKLRKSIESSIKSIVEVL